MIFLQLRKALAANERGALISNAEFRNPNNPSYPAFDWISFEEAVETRDKTLQESIAKYNPESQTLVFVFLLSRSGNSLAMWKRNLSVPIAIRKQHGEEIAKLMNSLAKHKYNITIDK